MVTILREHGVGEGDRVAAYLPNIPETVAAFLATASLGAIWSSAAPEFGARSVDRPLLADRAQGAAGHRRLPLRRQGLRPQRGGREHRPGDRRRARRRVRLPEGDGLAGRRGASRARVRTAALRPPAVGPLFQRDDRPAQVDRAGAGRHPARAPQEDAPARRRPGGRPRLLVLHHRLDDVELPGGRAAHAGFDRPVRRQPGRRSPVGAGRRHRDHHLRHQRLVHLGVDEGGGRAGGGPGPERAGRGGLHRLAALPRGLLLGLRQARRGDLAVLHLRRHRRVHGLRGRRAGAAGLPRRAPGTGARGEGRGLGRGRQRPDR